MSRQKVNIVNKDDVIRQTFRSGGPGGQHQNKSETGVRFIHPPSGARGESREERSQLQNERIAFRRMAEHPAFKAWVSALKAEWATGQTVEQIVEESMTPDKLKIEFKISGKWVDSGLKS